MATHRCCGALPRLPALDTDEAYRRIVAAHCDGLQICVHAIGDRPDHDAALLYERLLREHPGPHRHRVEHASVLDEPTIEWFAEHRITSVGRRADLVVLDDDPTAAPPDRIDSIDHGLLGRDTLACLAALRMPTVLMLGNRGFGAPSVVRSGTDGSAPDAAEFELHRSSVIRSTLWACGDHKVYAKRKQALCRAQ